MKDAMDLFHASISMTSSNQGKLSKNYKLHRNFLHTSKPSYSVLHENAAQTMTDVFVDASATNWTSGAFYQAHSIVLKAEPLLIEYGWYFMLHHYLFQDAIETSISTFNGHFTAVWGLKMDSIFFFVSFAGCFYSWISKQHPDWGCHTWLSTLAYLV